jgi:anthranilate phosphoribosyltransferase
MKDTLQYLFEGNILTRDQAKISLLEVGKGQHSEAEFASFLTVFKMRPIDSREFAGFRDAMFELSTKVDLSEFNGMDIVGTGGDGKNTFNISTLACFVVAGAGVNITKHGNYAASSNSGSSNVLEHLGYKFSSDTDKLKNDLERGGFCFLHAPLFHPAFKHIAPVRRALKVPTFFNILGPMINPSSPKGQLLGVNNPENFAHYKNIYETLDINFAVVNSIDGYDEISLTSDTRIGMKGSEKIFTAEDFNLKPVQPEKLYGGETVEEAAKIFINVLEGKGTTEQKHVVLANAGLALHVVFPEKQLTECVEMARESLDSGKALQSLKSVIQ